MATRLLQVDPEYPAAVVRLQPGPRCLTPSSQPSDSSNMATRLLQVDPEYPAAVVRLQPGPRCLPPAAPEPPAPPDRHGRSARSGPPAPRPAQPPRAAHCRRRPRRSRRPRRTAMADQPGPARRHPGLPSRPEPRRLRRHRWDRRAGGPAGCSARAAARAAVGGFGDTGGTGGFGDTGGTGGLAGRRAVRPGRRLGRRSVASAKAIRTRQVPRTANTAPVECRTAAPATGKPPDARLHPRRLSERDKFRARPIRRLSNAALQRRQLASHLMLAQPLRRHLGRRWAAWLRRPPRRWTASRRAERLQPFCTPAATSPPWPTLGRVAASPAQALDS